MTPQREPVAVRATFTLTAIMANFRWTTFDLTGFLPQDWRHEIAATAAEADFRDFSRMPILSRESANMPHISRGRVHAAHVRQYLPWLYRLYQEDFLEVAQDACAEPVMTES